MSQAQCSKCHRWFKYPTGDPPEAHAPCNCFPSPEQVREWEEEQQAREEVEKGER